MAEKVNQAKPLVSEKVESEIYEVIGKLKNIRAVKLGLNESTKILNRGKAHVVFLAADAYPFEISMHIPQICEDKNVQYCYVRSKDNLGKACGSNRPVLCATIFIPHDKIRRQIDKEVNEIIGEINKL